MGSVFSGEFNHAAPWGVSLLCLSAHPCYAPGHIHASPSAPICWACHVSSCAPRRSDDLPLAYTRPFASACLRFCSGRREPAGMGAPAARQGSGRGPAAWGGFGVFRGVQPGFAFRRSSVGPSGRSRPRFPALPGCTSRHIHTLLSGASLPYPRHFPAAFRGFPALRLGSMAKGGFVRVRGATGWRAGEGLRCGWGVAAPAARRFRVCVVRDSGGSDSSGTRVHPVVGQPIVFGSRSRASSSHAPSVETRKGVGKTGPSAPGPATPGASLGGFLFPASRPAPGSQKEKLKIGKT